MDIDLLNLCISLKLFDQKHGEVAASWVKAAQQLHQSWLVKYKDHLHERSLTGTAVIRRVKHLVEMFEASDKENLYKSGI
jgi:hypothetical protein